MPRVTTLTNEIVLKTLELYPDGLTTDELIALHQKELVGAKSPKMSLGHIMQFLCDGGYVAQKGNKWIAKRKQESAKSDKPYAIPIPDYLKDFKGVTAVVWTDPLLIKAVIRIEYSRDGIHYDPIMLGGQVAVFVGLDVPSWGEQMIVIWKIHSWRVTYRINGLIKTDAHNCAGMNYNLAVAPYKE